MFLLPLLVAGITGGIAYAGPVMAVIVAPVVNAIVKYEEGGASRRGAALVRAHVAKWPELEADWRAELVGDVTSTVDQGLPFCEGEYAVSHAEAGLLGRIVGECGLYSPQTVACVRVIKAHAWARVWPGGWEVG